jgi:hypothetical protein
MVKTLVPLLLPKPVPVTVMVAPAFTSEGVMPAIKGCDTVADGKDGSEDGDGEDKSDEFEQPYDRVTASKDKISKLQLNVLSCIAAPLKVVLLQFSNSFSNL